MEVQHGNLIYSKVNTHSNKERKLIHDNVHTHTHAHTHIHTFLKIIVTVRVNQKEILYIMLIIIIWQSVISNIKDRSVLNLI